MMSHSKSTGLTVDQIQEMLRREISTPARVGYLLLLLVTLTAVGLIGTLWLTEPAPLPVRTHVAFGLLIFVNVAWSALSGWVLTRRKVLYAMHRVIAGWMAVLFCGVFLLLGLTIAILKMNPTALAAVGVVGTVQIAVAIAMLRRARRCRSELVTRRNELAGALSQYRGACQDN